ncbi:PREDICTED: AT-hook motif nuclear-localized protein 9-like [Lupinus angustifolius]|uniref:AT-hook motif nuclear-localized protein 9-like n=1 Tax=Lupinus angustifolius TaxID=3871 RepID=UPI00092FBB3E|nr:PREDICTED: AT-hook motif nuclear-localized protein 9-like [Lupinus angustifolius]
MAPEATTPEVVVVVKEETREYVVTPPGLWVQPLPTVERRGRGRPPGSRKFQRISSTSVSHVWNFDQFLMFDTLLVEAGIWAETSVLDLTAYYMVTVVPGENVVTKLLSLFEEMSPDTVSVLSATGQISSSVFSRFGGTVTYAGRHEILSFSGQGNSVPGENALLICSLAAPDGTVFGGVIERSMIAATPVKIVIAVFKQMGIFKQSKRGDTSGSPKTRADQDSAMAPPRSGSA